MYGDNDGRHDSKQGDETDIAIEYGAEMRQQLDRYKNG